MDNQNSQSNSGNYVQTSDPVFPGMPMPMIHQPKEKNIIRIAESDEGYTINVSHKVVNFVDELLNGSRNNGTKKVQVERSK